MSAETPSDPALIGRRVANKFVVEKFLGGGSMGAVYRARDDSLDRHVALKVMHQAMTVEPAFVTRFHREARAASRLDHPSSVRVIEYGEESDGLLYIAMEYLEGRDLYRVIHEDWPLSDERIANIMVKALGAIGVAHEMGVIHRDLKPENIMVLDRKDDEGQDLVKVCDFGIAKLTDRDDDKKEGRSAAAKLTTGGIVVGTPEYMSPEQARGEKLDARSDLYSMGIILYQLLTGRTPFLADTALAVVLKHISEPPAAPRTIYEGVHQGLEAVCMRALAKSPNDRFQSAREMRSAIRAVMEGRPIDAVKETPTDRPASGSMPVPPTGPQPAVLRAGTLPMSAAVGASVAPSSPPPTSARKRSRGRLALTAILVAIVGLVAMALYAMKIGALHVSGAPVTPTASPSTSTSIEAEDAAPPSVLAPPEPTLSAELPEDAPSTSPSASATAHVSPLAPDAHASEPASSSSGRAAFSAAACHATTGHARSVGATNVKDLTLRDPNAAWSTCARSALKERPATPIVVTVRIRFTDKGGFKAATCNGCPLALSACVASATRTIASAAPKASDAGDVEFDVPVTFSCE